MILIFLFLKFWCGVAMLYTPKGTKKLLNLMVPIFCKTDVMWKRLIIQKKN
jgi:hypothetical protein